MLSSITGHILVISFIEFNMANLEWHSSDEPFELAIVFYVSCFAVSREIAIIYANNLEMIQMHGCLGFLFMKKKKQLIYWVNLRSFWVCLN